MDTPGYVLLSRMASQVRATEVLANNLANVDTPGFRAGRTVFAEFLERQSGTARIRGGREVAYAQDRANWRETAHGSITTTGNPLDVALQGEGFFAVETPRGERFTRSGRFTLSNDGRILDAEGNAVLGASGQPITLSPNDTRITISGDGTIRSENGELGKLRVVNFENTQRLKAEGDRLYDPAGEEPQPVERPQVVQGSVEGSNVRAVVEMNTLTGVMREFQIATNFADRENERITGAIDKILRRRG